jgi:hypothetical protein
MSQPIPRSEITGNVAAVIIGVIAGLVFGAIGYAVAGIGGMVLGLCLGGLSDALAVLLWRFKRG